MRTILITTLLLLAAACAGTKKPDGPNAPDTGTIGDVGEPRNRARVHTDLAAEYYQRGNMGVALEELRVATRADSSYAPAHSLLGLVYMDLKEQSQAAQSFERALSLAPNDRLRDELVPLNRKYPLRELIAACNRYLEKAPRDFITFEYVMLEGVNDSEALAHEAAALAREVRCKYNLIPFNPFAGVDYKRSSPERIRRFAEILQRAGITVTTRKTRGDDIAAACGQLAGDVEDRTRRRRLQLKEVRA